MKNKNLINEDIESIRYMMNYDTKKTLTENREFLNEQNTPITPNPGPWADQVANEIVKSSYSTPGTFNKNLITAIKKIKTAQHYYDVQSLINSLTNGFYKDFTRLINGEMESDNLNEVKDISTHFNTIPGISSKYDIDKGKYADKFKTGTFSVFGYPSDPRLKKTQPVKTDPTVKTNPVAKTDPVAKTPDKSIGAGSEPTTKKAVTPLPIPPQLNNSAGVKKFQEWVIGIKGDKTILGGYGADGKFGGRTNKAWTAYGKEYLNSSKTPVDTSTLAAPAVQTYATADQTKNTQAQDTLPMGVSGPANQVAQPTTTTTETLPAGVSGPANQVTKTNNTFNTSSATNPNKDKELKL
jgi:hypothetical protein